MNKKKEAVLEAIVLLFGICALGVFAYIWTDQRPPIPLEPEDQQLEQVDSIGYEGKRSGEWYKVRNDFVKANPRCEACGSAFDLNVHHIKPFKDRPELELDMDNLITLCREHHFRIGHDPDGPWGWRKPSWVLSNPNVRKDAERWRK